MKKSFLAFAIYLLVFSIFIGCIKLTSEVEQPEDIYQINGILYPGYSGLDSVLISRVIPLEEGFSEKQSRISGAKVIIKEEGTNKGTILTDSSNGRYVLDKSEFEIISGKTYSLFVEVNGYTLTAKTTVPYEFEVISKPPTVIQFHQTALTTAFTLNWSKSEFAKAYMVMVISLDPDTAIQRVTKKVKDKIASLTDPDSIVFYDSVLTALHDSVLTEYILLDRYKEELKEFREEKKKDPRLNFPSKFGYYKRLPFWVREENVNISWYGFFMYKGNHLVKIYALDENYSDFLFSWYFGRQRQTDLMFTNIQGGIGFFGSAYRSHKNSFYLYVNK